MGLRYRKSVKLGGLRINFSKSGVGYSYGVKGLRYTKTAKGKDRITASIPGTGVSYVSESGEKRKSKNAAEKYQPIQEPVKNIKMPLALKILAVICGSCFAAYYYFGQGQEISIAIASGALMGAVLYVVLYGVIGAILMALGIGKTVDPNAASNGSTTKNTSLEISAQERQEEFKLAGSHYCKAAIEKVAIPNPDWRKTCKALINAGKVNQKVYRFCRTTKVAKLVEEPDNSHDPNAVMVTVEGEKIGYISADEAPHVKEILRQHNLKEVTAAIAGGEYKTITPDAEMIKNQSGPFVTVNIRYQ